VTTGSSTAVLRIRIQDGKNLGSRINIPDHYFRELGKQIFWFKILKSLMRIRDPGYFGPGSKIEKFRSGTQDKHPRSTTLLDSMRKKLAFKK
jgi:hypothetical protein